MNGSRKTVKLSIMLIIMIALMFSTAFIMIIKATEDKDSKDVKNAKYSGEYTIEYLIQHFNLVTLGDVSQAQHIVGPVLIGGDIKSDLNHSQQTGGTSSYVKGSIKAGNVSCNENPKPTLYLGKKANAKVNDNGQDGANVNGQWYTNNPTVITDDYLNLNTLFDRIKNQSKSLVSGKKITKNKDNEIEIKIGDTVTIESLKDVSNIKMIGDKSTNKLTLINITASGEVTLPQLWINGQQASVTERDTTGNAIVWNFPNATKINFASSPSFGHTVAPNADVKTESTNYNGCLIAKSLDGHIEGHFYTYSGTKIPLKGIPQEDPQEKPEKPKDDKNNTTDSKNNTTGNNTSGSKNNTTKPKNNTTGNSTSGSKNNTTKNNTTKPKNNTTGDSITGSKNNTTKNNKTNKTNTSKGEDGKVLGAEWEKNNTSKNKTDKTTANGKLPQTGDEFSQKVILAVAMIALVVVFGVKYIKHKNKLDANK